MKNYSATFSLLVGLLTLSSCASRQEALRKDEEALDRFVKSHQVEVNSCFQAKQNAERSYELVLRAEQRVDGSFGVIEAAKDTADISSCVISKMQNWKTQPPAVSGPVELRWTYQTYQLP